jgi:hypothetical protein
MYIILKRTGWQLGLYSMHLLCHVWLERFFSEKKKKKKKLSNYSTDGLGSSTIIYPNLREFR